MGQTRVKAGHIELVQGSKYTKNVKLMPWICARDKRRYAIKQIEEHFFPSGVIKPGTPMMGCGNGTVLVPAFKKYH